MALCLTALLRIGSTYVRGRHDYLSLQWSHSITRSAWLLSQRFPLALFIRDIIQHNVVRPSGKATYLGHDILEDGRQSDRLHHLVADIYPCDADLLAVRLLVPCLALIIAAFIGQSPGGQMLCENTSISMLTCHIHTLPELP